MRGKNVSAEDLTAKKELALEVIRRLKAEYPDAGCTLDEAVTWLEAEKSTNTSSSRWATSITSSRADASAKSLAGRRTSWASSR